VPEVIIRPMEEKDIPRVYEIDTLSSGLPWTERSYRFEIAQNASSRLWVAEIKDENLEPLVVGFLVLWIIIDEAHIANIAVHPDFRRQKIAWKILTTGLLNAWKQGARISYLEVRQSNLGAQMLYRKIGFVEVGLRRHYYHDTQEDAVLMNLEQAVYENMLRLIS
jgi:[ribosomal protein S18]-alanine N-acetyltransferase